MDTYSSRRQLTSGNALDQLEKLTSKDKKKSKTNTKTNLLPPVAKLGKRKNKFPEHPNR